MNIQQYEIWLADLNPRFGTEPGKIRPVAIIQTDLLNNLHPSTIICPITTNVRPRSDLLRVHLKKGESNLVADCDIMVDQLRSIDNKRLIKRVGKLSPKKTVILIENMKAILDIE